MGSFLQTKVVYLTVIVCKFAGATGSSQPPATGCTADDKTSRRPAPAGLRSGRAARQPWMPGGDGQATDSRGAGTCRRALRPRGRRGRPPAAKPPAGPQAEGETGEAAGSQAAGGPSGRGGDGGDRRQPSRPAGFVGGDVGFVAQGEPDVVEAFEQPVLGKGV